MLRHFLSGAADSKNLAANFLNASNRSLMFNRTSLSSAVSKQANFLSTVLLYLDFLYRIHPFAGGDTPAIRDGHQRHQFLNSFRLDDMGAFEIESARLQAAEQGLDFPSFLVIVQRSLGIGIGLGIRISAVYMEPDPANGSPAVENLPLAGYRFLAGWNWSPLYSLLFAFER